MAAIVSTKTPNAQQLQQNVILKFRNLKVTKIKQLSFISLILLGLNVTVNTSLFRPLKERDNVFFGAALAQKSKPPYC